MYVPKPGELIYTQWCPEEEHSFEVMFFVGETANEWYACNFFDKEIEYHFPKVGYFCQMKTLRRFHLHRLSKKFKHAFQIGEKVCIRPITVWGYLPKDLPDALCEIEHLKLRYNCWTKKCYPGYKLKFINVGDFNLKLYSRLPLILQTASEAHMKKKMYYHRFWDV